MLHTITGKSIPNGTKFVAILGDGSGASLFMITDEGELLDAEFYSLTGSPDHHLFWLGYAYWFPLPSTFKLWFEQKEIENV